MSKHKKLDKVKRFKQTVEAMIMLTDDSYELDLLGALFLMHATRIFLTTKGAQRTKEALQKYTSDIKIPA